MKYDNINPKYYIAQYFIIFSKKVHFRISFI